MRSAVSSESVSRVFQPAPFTNRSTTASMVWRRFLSQWSPGSSGRTVPSTRTRTSPWRSSPANTSRCSPLRPRTTGARTCTLAPAGRRSRSSAISATLWRATGRPQLGQWGIPARAKSTRR